MRDITKYQGVIPAFFACYDENGAISTEGVKALTRHLNLQGSQGCLRRRIFRRMYLPACRRT